MRCFTIVQALPSHVIKSGFTISLSLPTIVHPHVVFLYDPVAGPQYYKEYPNTELRKAMTFAKSCKP
jgi:hypothetical protein